MKNALTILILLALAFAGVWAYYRYASEQPAPQQSVAREPIVIHHTMSGMNNVYSGQVDLPACKLLGTGAGSE